MRWRQDQSDIQDFTDFVEFGIAHTDCTLKPLAVSDTCYSSAILGKEDQ